MAITQKQFSAQMVAQLRLLNPNYSAEVGTPERLILDTVAQSLTDSQIDLIGLENALNIDTKFGSNLDSFVALFGFARKGATTASGWVRFSRTTPSTLATIVPANTLLQSTTVTRNGSPIQFATNAAATLAVGEEETDLIPITALTPGINGNVEAETITIMIGETPLGVTAVTNPTPTTNGSEQEDDNSLKVRFKNTIFRNLAGTKDQFLALSISTAFSTKANVVGPVSTYQEYVQVPPVLDTEAWEYGGEGLGRSYTGKPYPLVTKGSTSGSSTTLTVESIGGLAIGTTGLTIIVYKGEPDPEILGTYTAEVSGAHTLKLSTSINVSNAVVLVGTPTAPGANEYTTTLSTIPYAKNLWPAKQVFVTNGQSGITNYFFREGVDFNFNYPAKFQGDTLRAYIDGTGLNPFTDRVGKSQPNLTFTNVYVGSNSAIQAVAPQQVVLLEYSYTSTASRNSLEHNVTNAVDVYVDGSNPTASVVIFAAPSGVSFSKFSNSPNSLYYFENYRRDGEPTKRPLNENYLSPLLNEPVISLPNEIKIVSSTGIVNNYYLGTHYWLVHDVSEYEGTIRARDGIEWSSNVAGDAARLGPMLAPDPEVYQFPWEDAALEEPPKYSAPAVGEAGMAFAAIPLGTPIEVAGYEYDKNIPDLQAALEASRQITTDVLAHRARRRYFKLDLTVIYSPAATPSTVNNNILEALQTYLESQYFGTAINLSDLLQVVHSISGIANVRWTADVPKTTDEVRVFETDINGQPLLGASVDRLVSGGSVAEQQELFVTGNPTGGGFTLAYDVSKTGVYVPIEIKELQGTPSHNQTYIQNQLAAQSITATVTEVSRPTAGVINPIKSYRIVFSSTAAHNLPAVINGIKEGENPHYTKRLVGGEYTFNSDYFLRDNELPLLPSGTQVGDTVPGLIIRSRAQGTWERAN